MNLMKVKAISIIGIFVLTFLFHFAYDFIPCLLTSIFFPVNESIWEHQKLIYTSVIMYGIIDYIVLNKLKLKYNNFFLPLFISALLIVPVFLAIYLPIFYKIGPSMFINITIMLISIIVSQIISYFLLKAKRYNIWNIISLTLIIVSYIIFGYLTYNPIKTELFFDTVEEKYGINNYNI